MNKKIRAIMMLAAIALIVTINVYHSQRTADMSDVALANVEALAQGEVEFPYLCSGNTWNCLDDYYFIYFQGDKVR